MGQPIDSNNKVLICKVVDSTFNKIQITRSFYRDLTENRKMLKWKKVANWENHYNLADKLLNEGKD